MTEGAAVGDAKRVGAVADARGPRLHRRRSSGPGTALGVDLRPA